LNSRKCVIVNPEVVDVFYDHDINVLTANAEQTLIVDNFALNYRIFYELQLFKIDFAEKTFTLAGIPRFQELDSTKSNDVKVVKERDRAYYGSINHFMRSLRAGKLAGNKFEVYRYRPDYKGSKEAVGTTYYNTSAYYPATANQLKNIKRDTLMKLEIVYRGAHPEFAYDKANYKFQISFINFLKHNITIHENGFYDDPLAFMLTGYMGWREKVMAELLPLEYQPKLSLKQVQDMAKLEGLDSIRRSKFAQDSAEE
jgi:hypothetical protein